jgi:hypothetical protein
VRFARREQGWGRVRRHCKSSSWRKVRGGVRGRTAPGRRTVKLRYFASSCAKVATETSTFELGHFQSARITYLVSEFQFLVPPFMLYIACMAYMEGFLPGGTRPNTPHHHTWVLHGSMAAGDSVCSDAAVQGLCAGRGMVEARGGRAGARQGRTAQNSGRMFVFAATLVPSANEGDETYGMRMFANGKP